MNKEWLEQLASDVEAKHGAEAREKIFGDIQGVHEDHESKRKWFQQFVSGMDGLDDKDFLTAMMSERCPCSHREFEGIIRENYDESETLEEFAGRLDRGNLIEDIVVSLEGNVLTLTKRPFEVYGKHSHTGPFSAACHCGLASYAEEPVSDIFCHCCTVGFLGKMFKNALGKDVRVDFIDSVIIGGKGCTAAVHLPEKN